MKYFLIVLLVVAIVFFVWQGALFVRDLIKHVKAKKMKQKVDDKSTLTDVDRKEERDE